jgi:hypothetical protein
MYYLLLRLSLTLFTQMLKHSSILNHQELDLLDVNGRLDVQTAWKAWKENESNKRYVSLNVASKTSD